MVVLNRLKKLSHTWVFSVSFVFLFVLQVAGSFFLLSPDRLFGLMLPAWFWTHLFETCVLIFSLQLFFTLICVLYVNRRIFLFNNEIKQVLKERNLSQNLSAFYHAKTFHQLLKNLHNLFGLLKSFDHMKASRIGVETQTLKSILNNIQEGVILINTDRVVTHINHTAESMLRLLPGEIIDQSVSRKISAPVFLDSVSRAIEEDHKFVGVFFSLKDTGSMCLDVYPIKNAFGDVVRAVAIVRYNTENPSNP